MNNSNLRFYFTGIEWVFHSFSPLRLKKKKSKSKRKTFHVVFSLSSDGIGVRVLYVLLLLTLQLTFCCWPFSLRIFAGSPPNPPAPPRHHYLSFHPRVRQSWDQPSKLNIFIYLPYLLRRVSRVLRPQLLPFVTFSWETRIPYPSFPLTLLHLSPQTTAYHVIYSLNLSQRIPR